ncbi:amidohydrolase family protein [Psychromarinibacter sp. C21-152]|uniref:Amidohydrolase family protein n=1 Tax=Psychromarinibacter sediminicola TaxID=3033385 RepID=A0AAE3NUR6_9RHOB|nr:amidohydrolase family protein [Psychromarinibacter sediminicola]MDF0602009.1 amidohydrolase family protein [Psychromarinibacter sediminicola]
MTDAPFRIDCDFHLPQAAVTELLPYLDEYWTRQITDRAMHRMPFRLSSYPPNAPLTRNPAYDDLTVSGALDRFDLSLAVASMLHGVVALHNPDMRAALLRAVNDHLAAVWLEAEPRLRGAILVSGEDPAAAVEEIERLAGDRRFVQVTLLAMQEVPHGARFHWPVYEAAARHGLAVAFHAGSLYRLPPAVSGWPSYQFEDYVLQSSGFENILVGLLGEGVFHKFPSLRVVFQESGFSWLPTTLWRIDKTWRGVRQEVPWLDRPPSQIMDGRVFFGLQPVDAPGPAALEQVLRHIGGTGMLLFSTDFPHRQFDGDPVPEGFPDDARPGLFAGNALRAYPRLATDPAVPERLRTEEEPA